jgi:hypothetical protein
MLLCPSMGMPEGADRRGREVIAVGRSLRSHRQGWPAAQTLIALLILSACQSDDGGTDAASRSAAESVAASDGGDGQATDVFDLAEGDCFSALEGEEVTQVEVVSCDEPHVFEVFHLFDHPAVGSEPYPGDSEISAYAEEECIGPFEEFVGKAYEESRWFLTTITPAEETWSVGDREIVCTLSIEDESVRS